MNSRAARILIIGPSWIGDMVMAQSLFKLLKNNNSAIIIDVLAPEWCMPLLEYMPEVANAILLPFGHGELKILKRYNLARSLRKNNYDQAIVLPNSFKSALIPFFAKIPKRTGWVGERRFLLLNDIRRLNKLELPLMVSRFIALGLPINSLLPEVKFPELIVSKEQVAEIIVKFNIDLSKPILILCPGAEYGPSKRWPAEYFAEVAKVKIEENWQVWVLGSNKELPLAMTIKNIAKDCLNFTGQTSLAEAILLLSLARVVVSNDSGLMHIAAALARPLVVIYGSSSPQFTPPLAKQVKIISLNLPCSPCFKRECIFGHYACLTKLTPDKVLMALQGW